MWFCGWKKKKVCAERMIRLFDCVVNLYLWQHSTCLSQRCWCQSCNPQPFEESYGIFFMLRDSITDCQSPVKIYNRTQIPTRIHNGLILLPPQRWSVALWPCELVEVAACEDDRGGAEQRQEAKEASGGHIGTDAVGLLHYGSQTQSRQHLQGREQNSTLLAIIVETNICPKQHKDTYKHAQVNRSNL